MWYYSCIIKGLCDSPIHPTKEQPIAPSFQPTRTNAKPVETDTLGINEVYDSIPFPNILVITEHDSIVEFPEGQSAFSESIFSFLNTYQDKELQITGFYNDKDAFIPNLGLKRATYIKNVLNRYGVNTLRVSVNEQKKTFKYRKNGTYPNGILIQFKPMAKSKIKSIESLITQKTLYSGFDSKGFKPDNTLKAYALELKNFLDTHPNKTITITGHTDSTGDNTANYWYGMERAKNVQQYLISQGIEANRLTTVSKGESEPAESNATVKGRRKNRRIEIQVN